MQTERFNTLKGLKVAIKTYESTEEGDKAAGRVNAMRDEANRNLVYRSVLPEARDRIVDIVARETGIPQNTEPEVDKEGKPVLKDGKPVLTITEQDGKYVARVCAAKGWEDLSPLQPIVDQEVNDLAVDISAPERKASKPKVLPEVYLNAAKNVVSRGKTDALAAKLKSETNTTFTLSGDADKDLLVIGWAIKTNEDVKRREEEKKKAAEYASL